MPHNECRLVLWITDTPIHFRLRRFARVAPPWNRDRRERPDEELQSHALDRSRTEANSSVSRAAPCSVAVPTRPDADFGCGSAALWARLSTCERSSPSTVNLGPYLPHIST
jgi:hypothetical protein